MTRQGLVDPGSYAPYKAFCHRLVSRKLESVDRNVSYWAKSSQAPKFGNRVACHRPLLASDMTSHDSLRTVRSSPRRPGSRTVQRPRVAQVTHTSTKCILLYPNTDPNAIPLFRSVPKTTGAAASNLWSVIRP